MAIIRSDHANGKYCPKCEKVKPLDDFPRNRNRYDGHGAHCKLCIKLINHNSYHKKREEYNAHRRSLYALKASQPELIPGKKLERTHGNHCTCRDCRNARQQARLEAARQTVLAVMQPASAQAGD